MISGSATLLPAFAEVVLAPDLAVEGKAFQQLARLAARKHDERPPPRKRRCVFPAHPERFSKGLPVPAPVPTEV